MDNYAPIRSLTFPVIAPTLGVDLSKFKVRKSGQEYYGPCPVHAPKNNSTSFSYLSDGRFFCFSCSAKGRGAVDLTKLVKQVGFKDAVSLLEPLVGQTPTPTENASLRGDSEATEGILKPYTGSYEKFKVPCPWLEARCPDAAVRELYGVFCYDNPKRKSAYSGRVMLPVKDVEGVLYGYLGRSVNKSHNSQGEARDSIDEPKYLFPKGLSKSLFLFGADVLKAGKFGPIPLRVVYLVESPFCVMHFASLGIPAVASYGWSVSEEHMQILPRLAKGVVYLPDYNKSEQRLGVAGTLAAQMWVRCPPLPPDCVDPEQLDLPAIQALTR